MVTALNSQRNPSINQSSHNVLTIESIKSIADQIKVDPNIHEYHKKQAIIKIREIKVKFQYYQKAHAKKIPRRKVSSNQMNITDFLN